MQKRRVLIPFLHFSSLPLKPASFAVGRSLHQTPVRCLDINRCSATNIIVLFDISNSYCQSFLFFIYTY